MMPPRSAPSGMVPQPTRRKVLRHKTGGVDDAARSTILPTPRCPSPVRRPRGTHFNQRAGAASFRPEIEIDGTVTRVLIEQVGTVDVRRLGGLVGQPSVLGPRSEGQCADRRSSPWRSLQRIVGCSVRLASHGSLDGSVF